MKLGFNGPGEGFLQLAANRYQVISSVPGRVTLNEQKRQTLLRELADDSGSSTERLLQKRLSGFKGFKLRRCEITKQTGTSYLSKLERRLKLAVQVGFLLSHNPALITVLLTAYEACINWPIIIQRTFIFCPDNFVWPELWISTKFLLEEIMLTPIISTNSNPLSIISDARHLREMFKGDFHAVNWRVSELIGEVGGRESLRISSHDVRN
ncbi:hypothetical protein Pst134EA_032081 [Puccinia striiformis f. sp. tritici]|uniref:uncharacterized protein n=1 Tax=Puccinia striiformis f. sp. tritici TaxID=168172 RepID=UPI0020073A21|nr:uncharacterized protein Pst134EA_032081 [Puccinia striiformis f. sp. tritici]KAH9441922.1 hypothetical protein Pst134EA_032081 [Puccinia striiformis f. sp. tritici]